MANDVMTTQPSRTSDDFVSCQLRLTKFIFLCSGNCLRSTLEHKAEVYRDNSCHHSKVDAPNVIHVPKSEEANMTSSVFYTSFTLFYKGFTLAFPGGHSFAPDSNDEMTNDEMTIFSTNGICNRFDNVCRLIACFGLST